jgi:glycosyltransferase involved in cell wall biosynthesis
MRILYIASGIPVPGTLGGSTHAYEVARGLARRGHDVHLVCASREGWSGPGPFVRPVSTTLAGFHLHWQDVPKSVALAGLWPILRLARALRPDVIIERYYNFAGCGVIAARRLGIPSLLEVNALIVDPPEVAKRRLDDALGGPMRRWAVQQCQWVDRIITPLYTTVPAEIPREKIIELPWGADVERFGGGMRRAEAFAGNDGYEANGAANASAVLFMGSFRAWHGVLDFVRAGLLVREAGVEAQFVLVGDGPERAAAEALAAAAPGYFRFTGALPYEEIPAVLEQASIGVAPFVTAPHPALRAAGFFWSPLKVFEYMAAGLPVITPDIVPLNRIVRHEQEGLLYPEADRAALAAAITRLVHDPATRQQMGRRARERVVEHYSWQRHCADLERVIVEVIR